MRKQYAELLSQANNERLIDPTLTQQVLLFIQAWDSEFPIDYRWRKKYKIPFNSQKHREMSFLDMKIDLEEEKLFRRFEYASKFPDDDLFKLDRTGLDFTGKETDDDFDNIDLDEISKKLQDNG